MYHLQVVEKGVVLPMAQWTESEITYLQQHYETQKISETAGYLSRSVNAVRQKAKKLGLKLTVIDAVGLWTEQEEEYVKKYYEQCQTKEIAKRLGRSALSVKKKANTLGLNAHKRMNFTRWTEFEINYVLENYKYQGLIKTAKALNRSQSAVQHKARALGVTTKTINIKPWTRAEEIYLERKYEKQPVKVTAKRLHRTMASVQHKAHNLGLNSYISDLCNASAIASCFHHEGSVVIRWIKNYGLPAKTISLGKQTRYLIAPEEFWIWAETQKNIINWSKYIPLSLLPEPAWVQEVRINYSTPRHRRPITDTEKVQIQHMIRQGKTYKEIAQVLGRTKYGISRIGRQYRAKIRQQEKQLVS